MDNKWFYLVIGGVGMITISALLFGGFLHMLSFSSSQWGYLSFFAFAGASSMITGVLMMFDAVTQRVKSIVEKAIRKQEGKNKSKAEKKLAEQEKNHIDFLIRKSESLRPKKFKKNGDK